MPEIRVGLGTCGVASGAEAVQGAVARAALRLGSGVRVKAVGCAGMCHLEPLIEVVDDDGQSSFYGRVPPAAVDSIVARHFRPRGLWGRCRAAAGRMAGRLLRDETWLRPEKYHVDLQDGASAGYAARQRKVALENCGRVDFLDIDEYLSRGGYASLRKALCDMRPGAVIEAIVASGLRGRGGGGFPTGRKWAAARSSPGREKCVIANGDEGDPGAFMDRLILESDPHRVIEGMAIAAFAIGADRGVFYIRAEYPLAVINMRAALLQAKQNGLWGRNVLGSGFNLDLEVVEGAGAFVCGEETALMAALEGRRGTPRLRPPYPSSRGLWDKPTLVNNVETLACVPWILREGPAAFRSMGTPGSAGTKVFALAGKVKLGGLIEVPMGVTIRDIVFGIGGGVPDGRIFKAVQIGGPAGGCLPAWLADTPIDYEVLTQHGAIMGSGGLVVLDDTDCMVDMARFFMEFTQAESCGKCTFCRVGTRRMVEILDRLCQGKGSRADIAELRSLGESISRSSLCGLGQNAANPALTTLRYFPEEYEAHVKGTCPAKRCPALIRYEVTDGCIGCTLCAQSCPVEAIRPTPYERHRIDGVKCVRCGVCRSVCPQKAIEAVS